MGACQLGQFLLKLAARLLIHGSGISDQERIDYPTPRLCVEYLSVPHILADYQRDLQLALVNMTLDRLEQLTENASSLTLDTISHKIFLRIGRMWPVLGA